MSTLISIFTLVLIGYLSLGAILYYMQPWFTYKPTAEVLYNPSDINMDYEKVQLDTPDDLTLDGWYIPAVKGQFTVLFCHGNGGNIAHRLDSINIFNQLGLNCLIFDYRGYGNSNGKPNEEGTYIDARTAYDWLVKTKKVLPENIIIFGRSLGGAVAAKLASEVEKRGLIIESAFTSYGDIAQKFYPYMLVRPFVKYKYNTLENIKKANCPVLIAHSRDDELVPFEFGSRLYEAAAEPKEFLEIFGSHNDGFLHSGQTYTEGLDEWLGFLKNYQPAKTAEGKNAS